MRILLPLLLASCSVPIYVHRETDSPDARQTISEGAAFLDLRPKFVVRKDDAVITIRFDKPNDGVCGEEVRDGFCQRKVWSCDGPVFVGHEIGHALGLRHVRKRDEPPRTDNLMDPEAPAVRPTVTRKQKASARASLLTLTSCKKATK